MLLSIPATVTVTFGATNHFPRFCPPSRVTKLLAQFAAAGDTNVVLRLGQNPSTFGATAQTHALKGLVLDVDGKPDPGAQVAVFPGYNGGTRWIKTGLGGDYHLTWSLNPWEAQNGGARLIVRDAARNLAAVAELTEDLTNLDLKLKPALTLTGQVKNAANAPLPGAQVGFQVKLGNNYLQLDDQVQATDAQGRYEIKCLPADGDYLVNASAKGYGKSGQWTQNAAATNRLELSPLMLKPADLVIAGLVLKADDKPAAHVEITLNGEGQPDGRMTTDSTGRFHFQVCAGSVQISAGGPGSPGSVSAEGGDTNVVLRLEQNDSSADRTQKHKLKGLVTGPAGKPNSGAQVALFPGINGTHSVKTGPGGEYTLTRSLEPWQAQNGGRQIIVRDPVRGLAAIEDLPDDTTNLDLELKPALSLTGQVKNAGGDPMPGAQVGFSLKAGNSYHQLEDQVQPADAQGRYEIKCLPADEQYLVYASAKGYGRTTQRVKNDSDTNRLELSPLVLKLADKILAGQVLMDNDKPAVGVNVTLSGVDQPAGQMTTDNQGRFHFQVCAGRIGLFAYSQYNGSRSQDTVEAGDTNVVLRLGQNSGIAPGTRTHKLKGLVMDDGGKPDPGAQVAVFPGYNGTHWVKTGPGGEYTLTWSLQPWQLRHGGARLVVRDSARSLAAVADLAEDITNLDLKLEPALTLFGQVKNAADAPLLGVQVGLSIKAGNSYTRLDGQVEPTDAQGRYEIKCVPADRQYIVHASAKGYGKSQQTVENDSDTNRLEVSPLVLKPTDQVIAGQVLNDDGKPAVGMDVNLNGEGQPAGHMTTDSQGRFHFQVCTGQIRLFAHSLYGGGSAQATVEAGDTNIVLILTSLPGMARQAPSRRSLKGSPLPDLAAVNLAGDAAPVGKAVLMCLFDATQRPSRHVIQLLDQQAAALAQKNVSVLGVQAAILGDDVFNQWKTGSPVSFPVGRVTEKSEKSKWASSVTALPWLILADASHRVVAEGFPLAELDAQIQTLAK